VAPNDVPRLASGSTASIARPAPRSRARGTKINHPPDRAAASTVEPLMMGLRERGTAALAQGTEAES
jgi:hypothetical protein